jgi:hypothetical protein
MKIFCECGHVIYDQTDYISYKASFISDQDSSDLRDEIEEQIKKLVRKIERAASNKIDIDELVEDTIINVSDAIDKYDRRNIYLCLGCGRLFVDDAQFKLHVFIPQDDSVPKNLVRSIEGDKWKRPLRGHWQECVNKTGKGELSWGFGDEEEGYERFDDFEALKKRYFEVFARLQEKGILRDTFLRKGTEMLHQWPETDID